jgi:hypothetical protein
MVISEAFMVIYSDNVTRFSKFFLKDLFTNNLEECTEQDFDDAVTQYRSLYELQYDTPNAQNFILNGVVEARRER